MAELEYIPLVVAALDTQRADQAYELIETLDDYHRDELALQFRGSRIGVDSDLVDFAHRRGRYVIGNYRISDTPSKLALDIDTLLNQCDFSGHPRAVVDAITVIPPKPQNAESLQASVRLAQEVGVAIIGVSRSDDYFSNDHDLLADHAIITEGYAVELGFDALEVVSGALHNFNYRRLHQAGRHLKQIIASKTSWSNDGLPAAAERAFREGATSLVLGDTIAQNPNGARQIVDTVLTAHERATNASV